MLHLAVAVAVDPFGQQMKTDRKRKGTRRRAERAERAERKQRRRIFLPVDFNINVHDDMQLVVATAGAERLIYIMFLWRGKRRWRKRRKSRAAAHNKKDKQPEPQKTSIYFCPFFLKRAPVSAAGKSS